MNAPSDKIYRPNTTQLPNVLFDYWMGVITSGEFKILTAIIKHNLGCNCNSQDTISANELEIMTGEKGRTVRKAICLLLDRGLIEEYGLRDSKGYRYAQALHDSMIPVSRKEV